MGRQEWVWGRIATERATEEWSREEVGRRVSVNGTNALTHVESQSTENQKDGKTANTSGKYAVNHCTDASPNKPLFTVAYTSGAC